MPAKSCGVAAATSDLDDGAGFPSAAYARARATHDRGLGLYIARLIVEAHGGRMWAESAVGNASTFFFALPTEVVSDQR